MSTQEILTACGPLAALYDDPSIGAIMVDSPQRVLVEKSGKLEESEVQLGSPEALRQVIEALLAQGGMSLAAGQTSCEARLPDGTRVVAVLPPTAPDGPHLVIRHIFVSPMTWELLLQYGSVDQATVDLLQGALKAHASLLVAGGTASGKTTLLNRIAELIPAEERVVVAEGRHELRIQHPRALLLEAYGPGGMPFGELIETAAKLRPDWLVIGELTGPETFTAMEMLSRGYSGLTAVHAVNAQDALARLEAQCLMANLGLGLNEIRALIASAIRVVSYQERNAKDGRRRIHEIVEVLGVENGRCVLQPLRRFNPESGQFEGTGVRPSWEG